MEIYNKVENNAIDMYLCDTTTARSAGYKYSKSDHNIQMVCHIEEEENVKRIELIDMGFLSLLAET